MYSLKNILVIISSIAIILFVGDSFATKYNTDASGLSCINSDVEKVLLNVVSNDLQGELAKRGYVLSVNVIKENTSTEDRKFTIGNKSKYTCNTTIDLKLKADPNNIKAVKYITDVSKSKGFVSVTIDRDFSITENDLGTQYWVRSLKITEGELISLIKQNTN